MTEKKASPYPQNHGVLVVHKPTGITSARCLTTLKRLGQKKIGHAGTLDPMAEGVLLVLLGHATKISGHLMENGRKVYLGTLRLGQYTDTWDTEGTVLEEKPWKHINADQVQQTMMAWLGVSEQEVPAYSAAKHNGQPLYKLARAGKKTPQKVKTIEISRVEVLDVSLPYARFRVECVSGTYIRSLAHSLGMRLGCGAVLTALTREYSHPFDLHTAHTLDAIADNPELLPKWVQPIGAALPDWLRVTLSAHEARGVRCGMPVALDMSVPRLTEVPNTPEALKKGAKAVLYDTNDTALALAQLQFVKGQPMWCVERGLW